MVRTYKIRRIKAGIEEGKLCITASIQESVDEAVLDARLPAREMAALLPREIILGDERTATPDILEIIDDMLARLAVGREVRAWEYSGYTYFGFLKWGSVRFESCSGVSPG